jgi:hypothetical protein
MAANTNAVPALFVSSKLVHKGHIKILPPYLDTMGSDWLRVGRSGDRIPVGVRFSALVQTGSRAHPASCIMSTGSFPGEKRPGRGADHPPLLVSGSRKDSAIPLYTLWVSSGL